MANPDSTPIVLNRAREMFQSLDSHSILHVLHQSTNLSKLPVDEVLEMLKTRPVFTVDKESSPETLENSFDEKAEISRDTALFHGFCAVRCFMEAIVEGSVLDDPDSRVDVQSKIDEAQTHISSIFPLTFRVELLENIFSLLFISSEHFTDDVLQNVESDELETLESHSFHSSRTTSMESFVSIDSKTASPWRSSSRANDINLDLSASCTVSPDATAQVIDTQVSPNTFLEEPSEQQGFKSETVEDKSSRAARELKYDDNDQNLDIPQQGYQFRLPLEDKEKLLELQERKGKGLLVCTNLVGPFLDVMKKCLKEVLSLKDGNDVENRHKSKSRLTFGFIVLFNLVFNVKKCQY